MHSDLSHQYINRNPQLDTEDHSSAASVSAVVENAQSFLAAVDTSPSQPIEDPPADSRGDAPKPSHLPRAVHRVRPELDLYEFPADDEETQSRRLRKTLVS